LSSSSSSLTILLNGEATEVPAGLTLTGLLAHLGLPLDRVAVELDRQIVRKSDWDTQPVVAGAQLEVVHFVGGG
jgi:thiamine biosynthesis protein ThiS